MKLWPFRRRETRGAYTDSIIEGVLLASGAATPSSIAKTAALEACAGMYQRAFQAARVKPANARTAALTPAFLGLVAREMVRTGEMVSLLTVEDGMLRALPAGDFDVRGAPGRWLYRINIYGPTTHHNAFTVPAESVMHFRWATDPAREWRGVSPMGFARGGAKLAAEAEAALGDEMSSPRGAVLPVPSWTTAAVEDIKAIVPTLAGRFAFVESLQGGLDAGTGANPADDWKPRRIGPNPPAALRDIMVESARGVAASCGVPWGLLTAGEGSAAREDYRRWLHAAVEPVGRVVSQELSEKLETAVSLDFGSLRAGDMAGRARAFGSLVKAGMPMAEAAAASGVLQEED